MENSTALRNIQVSAAPFVVSGECDALCDKLRYLRISDRKVIPTVPNDRVRNYVAKKENAFLWKRVHSRKKEVRQRSRSLQRLVNKKSARPVTDYIKYYARSLNWKGNWTAQLSTRFMKLDSYSEEYRHVAKLFNHNKKNCAQVIEIERIQHPYFLAAFLMKKQELERCNGYQEIVTIFYSTRNKPVMSLYTNNHSQHISNRYKQDLSLDFPMHYRDNVQNRRVALLVHILADKQYIGSPDNTEFPLNALNMTTESIGVRVKYDSGEIYPAYKITYCINEIKDECGIKKKYRQIACGNYSEYDDHCNSFYKNDYHCSKHDNNDSFYCHDNDELASEEIGNLDQIGEADSAKPVPKKQKYEKNSDFSMIRRVEPTTLGDWIPWTVRGQSRRKGDFGKNNQFKTNFIHLKKGKVPPSYVTNNNKLISTLKY